MNEEQVKKVAAALWKHRFKHKKTVSWDAYRKDFPDIAVIYEEMARVAIKEISK